MPNNLADSLETMVDEVLDKNIPTGATDSATAEEDKEYIPLYTQKSEDQQNTEEQEIVEEQEEAVETVAEEGIIETEEQKPKSRAEARIRQLASEKKRLQEQIDVQQQQFAYQMQLQMQQQQQAYQQQLQEQSRATQVLQEQLRLLTEKREEDDPNLSPMDKFERKINKQAAELATRRMSPELEKLRNELLEEKRARESLIREQEKRAQLAALNNDVQRARSEIFLKNMQIPAEHAEAIDDLLLAFSAATNLPPSQAIQKFKPIFDSYYKARLSSSSKKNEEQQTKVKNIPQSASTGKQGTKAEYRPSFAALRKAGYDSYQDWRLEGAPVLQEKK